MSEGSEGASGAQGFRGQAQGATDIEEVPITEV